MQNTKLFFNAEKEVWLPRNIKCLGVDLRLPKLSSSDESVDRFVKSLDIGHVTQIPGVSGVSRTVTGLVFMIIDLHLRRSLIFHANYSGSMKMKTISGIDSVGGRARQQEILQQTEENLRQHLEQTGIQHVRKIPGKGGFGLGYLASRVREHFNDESTRHNKLSVRLIGNQAIGLARYSYRLVDTLRYDNESDAQKIKRFALGKIGEYLRNAGGLFNRIDTNSAQVAAED